MTNRARELAYIHYRIIGEEPEEEHLDKLQKIVEYLTDCGFVGNEILTIMVNLPPKLFIEPDDLPDSLWEGSLIKRNQFYYHKELQIISPAPYYDAYTNKIVGSAFYQEMKIRYTEKDIYKYFYRHFPSEFENEEREIGSIKYLLQKYSRIEEGTNLDFILYLIDEAIEHEAKIDKVFDLVNYENEALTYYRAKVLKGKSEGAEKITWR